MLDRQNRNIRISLVGRREGSSTRFFGTFALTGSTGASPKLRTLAILAVTGIVC